MTKMTSSLCCTMAASAAFSLLLCASSAVHAQTSRTLVGELSGDAERPGPGDPDGSGTFEIALHPQRGEICYELTVEEIQPATAAYIHAGPAGVAGPAVVKLEPPADGSAEGCVTADRDLINAIAARPASYYVNIYNAVLRGGAVRGQLGG